MLFSRQCYAPGEQFADPVYRPVGYDVKDIAEVAFWLHSVQFARPDQAVQQRSPLSSMIRTEEQVVFAAQTDHPQRIFSDVIVRLSPAIICIVRQRAVRMVLESQGEYDSQWAAICSIAPKIGCTPETLRVWVRQHERDTGGGDGGLTTAERQRLKELERENRELRLSNDILRQASAYFAKAEFDRLWKK